MIFIDIFCYAPQDFSSNMHTQKNMSTNKMNRMEILRPSHRLTTFSGLRRWNPKLKRVKVAPERQALAQTRRLSRLQAKFREMAA